MNSLCRQEYLKAMGIDVWLSRSATAAADVDSGPAHDEFADGFESAGAGAAETETLPAERFVIGPGSANTLLVCARSEEAATALAADIARSLESEPVWAWPAVGTNAPGTTLAAAIEEHGFDRVLIFGPELARGIDAGNDGIAGSVQLIRAEPLPVLLENGNARRVLWRQLSAAPGWVMSEQRH